jgi:P27 family predicted phage terminase small subunit
MGRRGPPKKPTALKVLQGLPGGKHKLNPAEPKPKKVKAPEPQFELSPRAAKLFKKVSAMLTRDEILTDVDLLALTRYADTLDKWLLAKEILDEDGFTFTVYENPTLEDLAREQETGEKLERTVRYVAQRPEVAIYRGLGSELLRLENNFGLTPSARSAVSVNPKKKDPNSIASKLFG